LSARRRFNNEDRENPVRWLGCWSRAHPRAYAESESEVQRSTRKQRDYTVTTLSRRSFKGRRRLRRPQPQRQQITLQRQPRLIKRIRVSRCLVEATMFTPRIQSLHQSIPSRPQRDPRSRLRSFPSKEHIQVPANPTAGPIALCLASFLLRLIMVCDPSGSAIPVPALVWPAWSHHCPAR
jgi:hypothetical protein